MGRGWNSILKMTPPSLHAVGAEPTPPDPKGMVHAVARYGYRLHDALADLVDNSVDAGASNVLIRFFRDDDAVRRIIVADDGHGMDEGHLREAMRFGVQLQHGRTDLGKYGLGLKSASFSQGQSVSVVTRHGSGWVGGRRWTIEHIERGWICEILDPDQCAALLAHDWNPVDTGTSGTVLIWEELDRLQLGKAGINAALGGYMKRLPVELGIVFHRFLADQRLAITLDAEHELTGERSFGRVVGPLDPFAHTRSGRIGYPISFRVDVGGGHTLDLRAHIWPANSKEAAYRLGGGRIAERQGFYFYRNDRVIQAGGWNGWRQNDSEPHTSLARAAIDLPPELDSRFRLDVKKSRLDVPPEFVAALDAARAGATELSEWIQAAVDTYRASDARAARAAPLLPGGGIPASVRRVALRQADLPNGSQRREVTFAWEDLDDHRFFELDHEGGRIVLNRRLRREVLQGAPASGADAPLVKCLLYLVFRAELDHQRRSAGRQRVLEDINELLRAAVKSQS